MQASKQVAIVKGNVKETLRRCNGFYECPKDSQGKRLGPLVGYAGKYEVNGEPRQYIGDVYANFAMAEEYPHVLAFFAQDLAEQVKAKVGEVDYVLAAPMGGIALAVHIAHALDSKFVFAEKKVVSLESKELRQQEVMQLLRHQIDSDSRVLLVEDVCNNFSTTGQMVELVQESGSEIVAVACALNRSEKSVFAYVGKELPVIPLLELALKQFRQDDPEVAADMKANNVVLKPKNEWQRLMKAMEQA
jgi:adenine/guanine phosphoribosyltransferase-like PRPP-binding protein